MKVQENDTNAIERAIDFLVADPVHFRSGYLKEVLWQQLPRWSILDIDKKRIENAALGYLNKTMRRDFWYMCRAMSRTATPWFWQQVEQKKDDTNALVAKRASYLFAYKTGIDAGERLRKQVNVEVLRQKYR